MVDICSINTRRLTLCHWEGSSCCFVPSLCRRRAFLEARERNSEREGKKREGGARDRLRESTAEAGEHCC